MTLLAATAAAAAARSRAPPRALGLIRAVASARRSRPPSTAVGFVPTPSPSRLPPSALRCRRGSSRRASSPSALPADPPSTRPHVASVLISDPSPSPVSPEWEYVLFYAGRSLGSPSSPDGIAGIGVSLCDGDDGRDEVWWGMQFLRGASCHEAEYVALGTGLEMSLKLGVRKVVAVGCNKLIVKQVEGEYKTKKPSLRTCKERVVATSEGFDSFRIRRVEKAMNERAKNLADEAMAMGADDNGDYALELATSQSICARKDSSSNIAAPAAPAVAISPSKTYVLRFDGGARGNPGIAGAGAVLYDAAEGCEVWSGCRYLGDKRTNNEAEYAGLTSGLKRARTLGMRKIVVQGDSQLVLRQLEGTYRVKAPGLRGYYDEAVALRGEFDSLEICHIERARNQRADKLANEAMDTKESRGFDNVSS
ncbi:hypothetical protein ACHAWF_007684 [Thalassiosira exigua]